MIASLSEVVVWVLWSAALVAAVVVEALFCGMESGAYVLNKIRLDLRVEAGSRAARLLRGQLDNPENFLVALLIGTNLAAYTATFVVSAMFDLGGAGSYASLYAIAVATPILFIFGESVPKNLFRRSAETLMYRLAWLLKGASVLFNACGAGPLVRGFASLLMRAFGRADRRPLAMGPHTMSAIVAEGAASGVLTRFQSAMAERVMRIAEVTLGDVMTPMRRVVRAQVDVGRDELIETVGGHDFSRLPLLDQDGQVVGILDIYDVLTGADGGPPREKASAPLTMLDSTGVTDALYRLQREHKAMAVVVDSGGRHRGIVTVKDLVEEIVGELEAW